MNEQENFEKLEQFENKTVREVTAWEWAARILPLLVLVILSICYFFKWDSAVELILEITAVAFALICIIWWYWAIHKIALTVKYIKESQKKLMDVLVEFRKLKKDVRSKTEK